MKVTDIITRDAILALHTAKIDEICNKDVESLSISELSFIKGVSAGSITTMKKSGASNEKILRTSQKEGLSKEEKVKKYLLECSDDEFERLTGFARPTK